VATAQNLGIEWSDRASETRARSISITAEQVFSLLFVAGLAWVPFWLGSNRLIAWGINAILFSGLAALYELSLLLRRAPQPVGVRYIRLPLILFAVAAAFALFQNATWAPAAWQNPVWQLASEVLGRPVAGSISVDRDLTALALIRLMTAASVFWLALQLGADSGRGRVLLWCIIVIGSAYAALGLFALGFMPQGAVFETGRPNGYVSSTFANRNHFATFAAISLLCVIALILRIYRRELRQSGDLLRLKLAALITTTGTKGAVPIILAFVLLAGLLLSGSRGGIVATTVGVFVLLVINALRLRSLWNGLVLGIFIAVLLIAAFLGFGDIFLRSVQTEGFDTHDRFMAYVATLRSILSGPFFGYGYGTFISTFPMFRDDSLGVWPLWDFAHNTYLEVFQGLGVVFGSLLIGSVVVLVVRCARAVTVRHRDATIAAAAVGVSFLVGVHALFDFSLEIQAVTLTYMAVLGLGVAQAAGRNARKFVPNQFPLSPEV
jgi:O-Antigen ligase